MIEETEKRDALFEIRLALHEISELRKEQAWLDEMTKFNYDKIQDGMKALDIRTFKSEEVNLIAIIAKNSPSRRMDYDLLLREFPDEYEALRNHGILTVTEPKSPTRLEIRKLKEPVLDAETGEQVA